MSRFVTKSRHKKSRFATYHAISPGFSYTWYMSFAPIYHLFPFCSCFLLFDRTSDPRSLSRRLFSPLSPLLFGTPSCLPTKTRLIINNQSSPTMFFFVFQYKMTPKNNDTKRVVFVYVRSGPDTEIRLGRADRKQGAGDRERRNRGQGTGEPGTGDRRQGTGGGGL